MLERDTLLLHPHCICRIARARFIYQIPPHSRLLFVHAHLDSVWIFVRSGEAQLYMVCSSAVNRLLLVEGDAQFVVVAVMCGSQPRRVCSLRCSNGL